MFWKIDSNSNSNCVFSRTHARGDTVENHWSHWSQSQNKEHIGSLRFISGFITPILRLESLECRLESLESFAILTPIFDLDSNATIQLHWSQLKGVKAMPMKRALYPDNWEQIARGLKERANWKCEECGAEHGVWILRHKTDPTRWIAPIGVEGEMTMLFNEDEWADRPTLIQLGVAHLDQNPANNDPSNLKVLCRGCHLRYDAPFHAIKARRTKMNKKRQTALASGQLLIFERINE